MLLVTQQFADRRFISEILQTAKFTNIFDFVIVISLVMSEIQFYDQSSLVSRLQIYLCEFIFLQI